MADGGIDDVGEYFLLLHSPFHSKQLSISLEHTGDRTVSQDAYNVSSESLLNCSQVCNTYFLLARRDETLTSFFLLQQTSYSQFGDADITEAILAYIPATQTVVEPGPPDSSTSETSLGKRKASEVSSTSSISMGPFRPSKLPRPIADGDENPFLAGPAVVENPFAPISIVSLPIEALRTLYLGVRCT